MLELRRANLFESDAIALVNTVNCVGVMGKGIAYQFARAYPAYAKDYMRRCKAEEVRLGSVYSFTEAGRVLISFPTKGHWKARSRLPDIEEGLISLRALIEREGLKSVAVPPLGCGNGGLSWADVKPLIIKHLGDLHDVQISVYEPAGDASAPTGRPPKLSLGHYVLVALRLRLTERTKLNLQKAAYFFNVFTKSQFFVFKPHHFGPFSLAIDPMLTDIQDYLAATQLPVDSLIEDGLRRSLSGQDSDRLTRWLPEIERTLAFCNRHIRSLEALATTHAVIAERGPIRPAQVVDGFMAWSEAKAERFTPQDVFEAVETLKQEGLVNEGLLGLEVSLRSAPQRREALESLTITLRGPLAAAVDAEAHDRGVAAEALVRTLLAAALQR